MIPLYRNRTTLNILSKLVTWLIGLGLLAVAFMFSVVLLAIVATLGMVLWGYLWWRTRTLRRAMKSSANGYVFEGESIVVDESGTIRSIGRHD
ncbi:MAG: hypothetical protein Q8O31_06510 [Rhodocyclaceae bacterium]|nr:hypothetical protein [Rhodocyclaceae bacterium]